MQQETMTHPTAAVTAFAAWLTGRPEPTAFGANHDCAPIAELVKTFCDQQGWGSPPEGWDKALRPYPPSGSGSESASQTEVQAQVRRIFDWIKVTPETVKFDVEALVVLADKQRKENEALRSQLSEAEHRATELERDRNRLAGVSHTHLVRAEAAERRATEAEKEVVRVKVQRNEWRERAEEAEQAWHSLGNRLQELGKTATRSVYDARCKRADPVVEKS